MGRISFIVFVTQKSGLIVIYMWLILISGREL